MSKNRSQPDTPPARTDRPSHGHGPPILRRSDQAIAACFIALGLVGLIGWMVRLGVGSGATVELDRAVQRRASFQIDMNHAKWVEWAELPGIGESVARRVIRSRETEGPFTCPEDLLRVKGIGAKTLEKIRPHLLPEPEMNNVAGGPHRTNGNAEN